MSTYKENAIDIENFLVETVFNLGDLKDRESQNFKKVFKVFPSLELIYTCDENTMVQTSDNIYRNKTSQKPIGRSREYLLHKMVFTDSNITISKPYISSATGEPVIALTLGLAIFDLAKTLLAQEVVFKSYSKNTSLEYKVLTKFSITIIIALLIESLMVVFKIAIDDYSHMIYALYLISGVSILILSLGVFIYFTKKKA
jgi:hypothetical protein